MSTHECGVSIRKASLILISEAFLMYGRPYERAGRRCGNLKYQLYKLYQLFLPQTRQTVFQNLQFGNGIRLFVLLILHHFWFCILHEAFVAQFLIYRNQEAL